MRMATVPWSEGPVAHASISSICVPLAGARHVRSGTFANIGMSNAPECVLSVPEMPAPKISSVAGTRFSDSSCCNWSNVRWKNVAEVARTGLPPAFAMPAAKAAACSSAMPVST